MNEEEEEVINVSDDVCYEFEFDMWPSGSSVVARGTSEYYYSVDMSSSRKYMAFKMDSEGSKFSKLAVWRVGEEEEPLVAHLRTHINKLEFLPNEDKIAVMGLKPYPAIGSEISILDVNGEQVGSVKIAYERRPGVVAYQTISNFSVSPDGRYFALGVAPRSIFIYDLRSEEVVNEIRVENLGERKEFEMHRLFWEKADALVVTSYKKPLHPDSYGVMETELRCPMKYATVINAFTGEVLHRVPIRYTSWVEYYDAYFVSPNGEYLAVVNRSVYLPRISDFNMCGDYFGGGDKWRRVKKYRPDVDHVGWSPDGKEVIYEYKNGFVTHDCESLKPTRRIKIERAKRVYTWRIFWLSDNRIYFVLDHYPTVVCMLKL